MATGYDEVSDGLQVSRSKSGTFMNPKVTAAACSKLRVHSNIRRYIYWCRLLSFCKAESIWRGRNGEMTGYKPTYPL